MTSIATPADLEDVLSRPTPADLDAARALRGDLLILGAGGKMGPSLAVRAARAIRAAGVHHRVIAVSRFTEPGLRDHLDAAGIVTHPADLLDRGALAALPDAPDVVFMAGRKFGTQGGEHWTWAMNVLLPALAAERYRDSRIVVFSSGNVYPMLGEGARESTPTDPVGEYAQTVRGRERVFEHYADRNGTPSVLLRLNYAIELRYGVIVDIGRKVFERRVIDLSMGRVNVIWQGDANSIALRSFALCAAPPAILNLTGPETKVRDIARRFGEHFGVEPQCEGLESPTALLNDASKCRDLFGEPEISLDQVIEWAAHWIRAGGESLGKPTHFEARDGRF